MPHFSSERRQEAASSGLTDPIAAFLGNGHDWRVPLEFFPAGWEFWHEGGSKKAKWPSLAVFAGIFPNLMAGCRGLWRDCGSRKRDRHDWRFLQNFSPRRRSIAVFGARAMEKSEMAMIGGFRENFSQAGREFRHDRDPRKA